jgi:outer membrane protein assembly factor BamB
MRTKFYWIVLGLVCGSSLAAANDWTRFRGPNGSGVNAEAKIPAKWTLDDAKWRVKLPGIGHSSPVVWDEKIFLTSADHASGERLVLCRNTHDGSEVWTRRFKAEKNSVHAQNSFASATPAVDARHVYVLISAASTNRLVALTHEGKQVWEKQLGPFVAMHGPGTSPIVHGGLVFVNDLQEGERLDPGERKGVSSVVALDAATGEIRWRTPRDSTNAAYSTPCVVRGSDDREQLLLTSNAHGMTSFDLLTGHVNWELGVFDLRTVSSPLVVGNLAIGTSGSGGGGHRLVAIDMNDGKPKKKYEVLRSAPYVPTPVAKGDLLFLCYDKGVATCIDVQTGKVHWQERVDGYYSGSPVIAGDYVYMTDYNGAEMVVLAASKDFKLVARNPLGEPSRATPAIVGNTMYIRTESHLMAIGGREE